MMKYLRDFEVKGGGYRKSFLGMLLEQKQPIYQTASGSLCYAGSRRIQEVHQKEDAPQEGTDCSWFHTEARRRPRGT